jgi:hypothetical protein
MNIVSVIIGGLIIGYFVPDFVRLLSPKNVDPIPLFYKLLFAIGSAFLMVGIFL